MDIYRTARLDEILRHILFVDIDGEAVFVGKQGRILK